MNGRQESVLVIEATALHGPATSTRSLNRPTTDRRRRGGRGQLSRARSRAGFMLSLPALLLVTVFVLIPTVQAVYYSFTNWDGTAADFLGLSNYKSGLVTGPGVHRILLNNLVLILSVPIGILLEYCVAYVLWMGMKGGRVVLVLLFLPITVSWAAVGLTFRSLLLQVAPEWLANPNLSLMVVVLAFLWATAGANILIIYAGLSTMDTSQIEAARLDGAGAVKIMLLIVAPNVIAFLDFALITTLIASCTSIFGLIYTFNFGGPGYSTTTLEFALYRGGFASGNFGLAAATGVVIMLVTIVVSIPRIVPSMRRLDR
jgi:multiple sugar transport system permease protein